MARDLAGAVADALGGIAPEVCVLHETASTNDEARALARGGAPHLTTVVAEHQTAGRGRRGRTWTAEPGGSLLASWVVRPTLMPDAWSVIPLLAGVACADAVRGRTRVDAALKWPNDLLVGERKLGGILVEAEPPFFAVVGVGINVAVTSFPPEVAATATSLALAGAVRLDRADLLAAIVRGFDDALARPDAALERYRAMCATIGRRVSVTRAGGLPVEGMASGVDGRGALLVEIGDDVVAVSAGDVIHLR